jgi:hypothetical protein
MFNQEWVKPHCDSARHLIHVPNKEMKVAELPSHIDAYKPGPPTIPQTSNPIGGRAGADGMIWSWHRTWDGNPQGIPDEAVAARL